MAHSFEKSGTPYGTTEEHAATSPQPTLPEALTAADLEPVFWPPSRVGAMSAWWGHVPFAHWLITALRPRVVVELGTHNGVSFCAFCEAVHRGNVAGRCYAVDTWKGDKHAGYYDEGVFQDLSAFVRSRYGAFSELVRSTFDEALAHFADGSIDLLHIDGLHTYEAVKSDFESWRVKLSERAIVLLHDTNVRRDDFGVWKLWAELRDHYPTFEFLHAYGLGIAAVGRNPPAPIAELCGLRADATILVRDRFAQLGERWVAADRALENEHHIQNLRTLDEQRNRQLSDQAQRISNLETKCQSGEQILSNRDLQISHLTADVNQARHHIGVLDWKLAEVYGSSSWRITGPIRWIKNRWRAARKESKPPLSDVELIEGSDLFDQGFYSGSDEARSMAISPVEHYVRKGEAAGLMPSPLFDPVFYAERYPEIAGGDGNLLSHYIRCGRSEGRHGLAAVSKLTLLTSRLRSNRETIVVAFHEATRTGAPILGWNIVAALKQQYNVVALLKRGGPIERAIADVADASVTLPDTFEFHDAEFNALVRRFVACYAPKYIVANSAETRYFVPAFERAGVPAIALIHEFSNTVRPIGAMYRLFQIASEIVFSAQIVADAALDDYYLLGARSYRIMAQGRCLLPKNVSHNSEVSADSPPGEDFSWLPQRDGSVLVIGLGTITQRKGVEFFIAAAASIVRRQTNCRIVFAWIGHWYDFDELYVVGLKDQIRRSGLENSFLLPGEFEDLEPIYARADLCFLSSRLDPLPNISIEAAARAIPVICFDRASGTAEILAKSDDTRGLVVPYLDAEAAANKIVELAEDPDKRAAAATAIHAAATRHFDMARYVEALDKLGTAAVRARSQTMRDHEVIIQHDAFNATLYLGQPVSAQGTREALANYLDASRRVAPRNRPRTGLLVRRPLEGFHPLIYAAENPDYDETSSEDPLAHYARSGFPHGRWQHQIISPASPARAVSHGLRVAVHGHFHYTALLPGFIERLRRNRSAMDLLLTTTSEDRSRSLTDTLTRFGVKEARVIVIPNRGRDIGAMLTALGGKAFEHYDVIGHIHGKRSDHVVASIGEQWRNFLFENLIGGEHAMADVVLSAFAADDKLGLVYSEDPNLNGRDWNRTIAEGLAERMELAHPLPHHFEFPLGTMFWARPAALGPLLKLDLRWDDYPAEPLPIDGTLLHALERLVPFSAAKAGYGYAKTHVATALR